MTQQLRELAQWLAEAKVTAVAMEATGIYWVPVWNVLEPNGFELLLINPEHYKAVRGKKTDVKDGERIAELLQDGLCTSGGDPRFARSNPVPYQAGAVPILDRETHSTSVRAMQRQVGFGGQ